MTWEEQKRLAKMTVEDRLTEVSNNFDDDCCYIDYACCRVQLDGSFTVDELDMIIQAITGPRGHNDDNPDCCFDIIPKARCSCEADRLK